MLLPFQGEHCLPPKPRALPWADCSLAFQAVYRILVDNHFFFTVAQLPELLLLYSFFLHPGVCGNLILFALID